MKDILSIIKIDNILQFKKVSEISMNNTRNKMRTQKW